MGETTQYQTGQRWFFQTDDPEFETTLVIGKIKDAHPEWGDHEVRQLAKKSTAGLMFNAPLPG